MPKPSHFLVRPAVIATYLFMAGPVFADDGLADLGTNAVAIVETVAAPSAKLQPMDLLFPGQVVDLGAGGKLAVSYFSGCRSETIVGGKVRFGAAGAAADGGKVTASIAPGCADPATVAAGNSTEAGAVAVRGAAEAADDPVRVIREPSPVFKWLAGGTAEIRILDPRKDPAEVIWAGQGTDWLAYPADGPKLRPNVAYEIEVHAGKDMIGHTRFLIDPELAEPNTVANRLVVVAKP